MAQAELPSGSRRRRTVVAAGGGAVLLVIAAVVTYLASRSDGGRPSGATTQAAPGPTSTPAPATPSARAPVARPGPRHDLVPPATPTTFTLTGPKFSIHAQVCPMANIRPYDPPGDQRHTICWVRSGFGVAPSSRQPATTYLFGHAWAGDPLEVLNKASALATAQFLHTRPHLVDGVNVYPVRNLLGYRLVLRTSAGTLTYRVRRAWAVSKNQLGFIRSWLNPTVPDRVLLTTCAELHGVDYDYNVILDASLYSSVRAAPAT